MRFDNLHKPKYLCIYAINSAKNSLTVLLLPGVSTLTVFSASCLVLSVVSNDLDCAASKNRPSYFFLLD